MAPIKFGAGMLPRARDHGGVLDRDCEGELDRAGDCGGDPRARDCGGDPRARDCGGDPRACDCGGEPRARTDRDRGTRPV